MKKNLGRGLAYLMGNPTNDPIQELSSEEVKIYYLPMEHVITNRAQPRKHFDQESLQELAESIKKNGLISPILVKQIDQDKYEIIAGERRFRSAQLSEMTHIPVILKNVTENSAFELSIIENIQRQDLNIVEEAKAYRDLINKYSYSQNEVALIVGKSRSHITNILRILTLPDSVLDFIIEGKITMGHARTLIGSDNPEQIVQEIIENNLSVRDVEQKTKKTSAKSSAKLTKNSLHDRVAKQDIKTLEEWIAAKLGVSVKIIFNPDNSGSVSVSYNSLEKLDQIIQLLGKDL